MILCNQNMFKIFTSDLRRNIVKILCLTIGLAIGFVLVAKIYFEKTYDSFFPDSDRIYIVTEMAEINGEYKEFTQIPGGTAPALKRYIPQIEAATRFTFFVPEGRIKLHDDRSFDMEGVYLADSCFFDVFKTDIIEGDYKAVLSSQDGCMIPRSLAEKICGDVIGMKFSVPSYHPTYEATIMGVYEDFQENTTLPRAIFIGLPTISRFYYDGSENFAGNDRYVGYVRLAKDTDPESLQSGIRKMLEDNLDKEMLDQYNFNHGLKPLIGSYTSQDGVKTMVGMLSLLSVIILLSAGINYLLVTVGQFNSRAKEMAVRKCYGTGNAKLFMMVVGESVVYMIVSLVLAIILISISSGLCEELLGTSISQLFSVSRIWAVEGLVILVLLILTGVIPAWIYCKTPVSTAFRGNRKSKRIWKLAMLSLQFFSAGLLLCLLALVARQFKMMSNLDWGFDYENVAQINVSGLDSNEAKRLSDGLKQLGIVEHAAFSDYDFINYGDGNNIWVGETQEEMINVADLNYSNPEIIDVMGLRFTQGGNFVETADSTLHQVIVEERMIDVFKKFFGSDDDNLIGKTFKITGHYAVVDYTICGVVENMRRGGFEDSYADKRAGVIFPTSSVRGNLFVKFSEMTESNLKSAQEVISKLLPDKEIYLSPMKTFVDYKLMNIRRFQKSVMVVGIAILIIALLGLIGYTSDEVQRRAKEIAIRKVSGTSDIKILKLFCVDIMKVALPSLLLGGAAAYIAGRNWLSQYTDQVSMSPIVFVLCVIVLLMLIFLVVSLNSLGVARSNPVNHLRNE